MITDQIRNSAVYSKLRPGIRKALIYLASTDFTALEPGVYHVGGDPQFRAIVSEYDTRPEQDTKWEAHRMFIDVQFVVSGEERMGFTFSSPVETVVPYDDANDIVFFRAEGQTFRFPANGFVIFYPGELHQPGIMVESASRVKKVVVKIPFNEYE